MFNWRVFIIISLFCQSVFAAGPSVVAKANWRTWQHAMNTTESFDVASRAAILMYAQTLQDLSQLNDENIKHTLKLKSLERASITTWLTREQNAVLANYQAASKTCKTDDWTCVPANGFNDLAKPVTVPKTFSAWQHTMQTFVQQYLLEQLRLAALFPKVSSEIATFNANEWTDANLSDRQFLLTFDDGPSALQGNTDATLAMLAAEHKNAVFFVLGQQWQTRQHKSNDLAQLYQNQCVALHGFEHQSHAKWANWQDSIIRTKTLLLDALAQTDSYTPLFRPPYGQRTADSGVFFQQQGLQVALWNLDSQDWNAKINSDDILQRMLSLMLIKRHGVLLFHDVHNKAKTALPLLFAQLGSAVTWQDCHAFAVNAIAAK